MIASASQQGTEYGNRNEMIVFHAIVIVIVIVNVNVNVYHLLVEIGKQPIQFVVGCKTVCLDDNQMFESGRLTRIQR